MNKKIYVVILAGGKGTRLNCTDIPKVLINLNGRPMLRYVYDAVKNIASKIIIITGFCGEKINKEMANEPVEFAHQAEQLGTAHALAQAEKILRGKKGITLVVNGDGPLFTPEVFEELITEMRSGKYTLVFSSVVEDNHPAYGRITRNKNGKVTGIVEAKDATTEQEDIREKNVGIYAIDNTWLWPALKKVGKSSISGEYYITDLVKIALDEGKNIEAVKTTNQNIIKGINTPEELREVESIISNLKMQKSK